MIRMWPRTALWPSEPSSVSGILDMTWKYKPIQHMDSIGVYNVWGRRLNRVKLEKQKTERCRSGHELRKWNRCWWWLVIEARTIGDKSRAMALAVRMSAWRLCAAMTWTDSIGIEVKQNTKLCREAKRIDVEKRENVWSRELNHADLGMRKEVFTID